MTAPSELPARLVLYDGVCGLCDRSVQWLLAHDRARRFHFATLQGETAAAVRARHPGLPDATDSVLYVEQVGGTEQVFSRSEAAFRIVAQIDGWRWLSWLGLLPRPLTDLGYRAFARIRYHVWGKLDTCRIPVASDRARFVP